MQTISEGRTFDAAAQAAVSRSLTVWEENWVNNKPKSAQYFGTVPVGDTGVLALKMCRKYAICKP